MAMPTAHNIPIYRGLDEKDRQRLTRDVSAAFARAAAEMPAAQKTEPEEEAVGPTSQDLVEIPEFSDLIGVDPAVYRQINAALKAGKQHLMFYGPPGTGKTTLAQLVAGTLHDVYTMITGSADWTSQDVIGGYQPVGEGRVSFVPGVLLQNFDRPLIVDELNRCDIDKVIGPLFTVLSEQKTTLPYRTDIADAESLAYVILPKPKPSAAAHEFAPKPGWRILATINSIDKAALYQMSFALTRRFGWIYVDAPRDLRGFLVEVMHKWEMVDADDEPAGPIPLERIWRAINGARVIGPAPILDMLKTVRAIDPDLNLLAAPEVDQASAYLDGFYMYVLPMLDGILRKQAIAVATEVRDALDLADKSEEARTLAERLMDLAV
ncbi:AAA family ATPase [Roseospira navarrensis]|uniref:AAA domain-containing protein n=1 Tax=Roseospira navarrensis TaxID=140058 RepID=A0A7X1ZFI5_9PROT|nr:AAA family ATPase [Roseospira navarrensis]MQX37618.1 AAA domain-containing protein [Roseospira navarrensis]